MTFKEYVHIPQINYFKYGTYGSVDIMQPDKLYFLVMNGVSLLIHSHPPGMGTRYSDRDLRVMRGIYLQTNKSVIHGIVSVYNTTKLGEVSYYAISRKTEYPVLKHSRRIDTREILESGKFLFNYSKDYEVSNLLWKIQIKDFIRKIKKEDYYGIKE